VVLAVDKKIQDVHISRLQTCHSESWTVKWIRALNILLHCIVLQKGKTMLASNRKHRNKDRKFFQRCYKCKRFRTIFVLFLFFLILCVINSYFYVKPRIASKGNGRSSDLVNTAIKAGSFFSSFNPKDNKIQDDILPISNDGNYLRHQEDVELQLVWAQDGTVVKRLGEKGLIGELIGEPFICPSYF
jgi:hypothetical protein